MRETTPMMPRRPGRPPEAPTKEICAITLRVPAAVKTHLIEQSEALDISINEYMIMLIERSR
jgi:predicted HicB family RNase H-like nuclease